MAVSVASTWDVDGALLATLNADAALVAIVTDGIYFGEARPGATKFLQLAQIDQANEDMFDAVAFESILYQVKAVLQDTSALKAIDAAKRIQAVLLGLTPATFTPANYQFMLATRTQRIRYTERDTANPDLLWQHHGAQYEIRMVPTG